MIISTAGSRTSKRWKRQEVSWDWLLQKLQQPKRTGETVAEYRRMSKDEQAQRKDVGGFVGGEVVGGRRVAGSVHERWLLTLDADDANPDDWADWTCLFDYRSAVYSTHSHTPEHPRLRWIIPLARPVGPEEYQAIARKVAEYIGIETMDRSTYQPERLMYWPSCPEDGEYLFEWQDGPLLQPDQVLRQYGPGEAWRDASAWPISSKEQAIILREARHQGAPEQKPGVVGKFCRAFSVPEAIDRWLSDKYEECENMPGRYTYRPGSSSGGAVLYDDDRFLYSHHATDPAGGQLCNAFDLVRLHLFGEQDTGHEQQEITRRPSYQAMCDMVREDEECKRRFFAERIAEVNQDFADLGELQDPPEYEPERPADTEKGAKNAANHPEKGANDGVESRDDQVDDAWLSKLTTNRKTGEAESTIENAVLILANDRNLAGRIALNEFSGRPTLRGSVPWRKAKDGDLWEDADEANLRLYLERRWGLTGKDKINDALSITLKANAYHPVREYLLGLEWDGVERLDTCIIRYLETDDTPYVRAVTRKWMCGAVKRIMEPGCKFDSMLLIQGKQNIGKSRFCQVISRGWINTSIARMDGKEAYDIIAPFYVRKVTEEERRAIDVTWNAQEDFTGDENALVVADGSGSMYWYADPKPAAVAQSLAIYYAERNHGAFHNHFITFSMRPQLVEIKGSDILEKAQYCASYNECANTNLQAVFDLILDTAVKNHLPQSELPAKLYIISDMEFDACVARSSITNFEHAKAQYQAHGYTLPEVVFWNVNSRNQQQPVTKNEQGVALVSGNTARIFSLLKSGLIDPYAFMLSVLGGERYAVIAA